MCVLFLYNGTHDAQSDYNLILVSNRDEYYDRPTRNMAPWIEDPNIIGGRDLEVTDGGTWLAISPLRKRIGVLLNLPGTTKPNAKTRGKIVVEFVKSMKPVHEYIEYIKNYTKDCNEFVFVSIEFLNNGPSIFSYNNAEDQLKPHCETISGFGNCLPDRPLKKIEAGRNKMQEICSKFKKVGEQKELIEKLIEILKSDERYLPDHQLEKRSPSIHKELSSICVCIPQGRYGTRTHTIVLVTKTGHMEVIEITLQSPIDPHNPSWHRTEFQFDMENSA